MRAERFEVEVEGGTVVGRVAGSGPEVLLLHGGPGLSDYLDTLLPELDGFRVARYQQRGLDPSSARGPYDVRVQVDDVVAVLAHLGWSRPTLLGHSWGGHLLLHLIAARPECVGAALVVDPLGAVGDGGEGAFEAELARRTPPEVRDRARELDDRALAGTGTEEESLESLRLVWPAYFADPGRAGSPPSDLRVSVEAYSATFESVHAMLPGLAERLAGRRVPARFVHGAASPVPVTASTEAAAVLGAQVDVVPDAGHFIWLEAPGAVRRSLEALA